VDFSRDHTRLDDYNFKTECIFTGYGKTEDESIVQDLFDKEADALVDELKEGDQGVIFLYNSPFYPTMGGQQCDIGKIIGENGAVFEVTKVFKGPYQGLVYHCGVMVSGTIKKSDKVQLIVDADRRSDICKNHSATHLLQKALKTVLGDHVNQKGSEVAPDRLRFELLA
jgi:Alanyl-tRNA synthetase